MDAEDFVMAGLINGVAWLIPYCANAHILGERRAGGLRLRASGEHTIHPCPERSILCARRAST